jgi:hypothetical protein
LDADAPASDLDLVNDEPEQCLLLVEVKVVDHSEDTVCEVTGAVAQLVVLS